MGPSGKFFKVVNSSFNPYAKISLYSYKVGPAVRSLRKRMSSLHSTIAHGLMCTAPCNSLYQLKETLTDMEIHLGFHAYRRGPIFKLEYLKCGLRYH